MVLLKENVSQLIGGDARVEVYKVTGRAVKKAALGLKPGKNAVSGGFTSDAILNAPDIYRI